MKQQLSVEWLQECIFIHLTHEQLMQFEGLFQQAKEMEKQEIFEAYLVGADYSTWADAIAAKKYYNEKYNK